MSDAQPPIPQAVQLPIIWVGVDELPIRFANAFVSVVQPGEVFLTFGAVMPPMLAGGPEADEESLKAQLQGIPFVQASPIVRLALTPSRLDELINTLQQTKANLDAIEKASAEQRGDLT